MGLYDNITCKYPLPIPGANELEFQTKDTPRQDLDQYEIREDGTLWLFLCGQWRQEDITGEIRFYTSLGERRQGWLEFSAYFESGRVVRLNTVEHTTEPM